MNSYHRKTFDPARTSPIRQTQWIARVPGHRCFILGDALTRRSGTLRAEPVALSQAKLPAAIARSES